jgi:hypothetical protein
VFHADRRSGQFILLGVQFDACRVQRQLQSVIEFEEFGSVWMSLFDVAVRALLV